MSVMVPMALMFFVSFPLAMLWHDRRHPGMNARNFRTTWKWEVFGTLAILSPWALWLVTQ
ncbi:MAG TPA: hypothetical protein VKD72_28845 [Gemmataceae bacterium]|nr:hypothetical protein [Gemmataceae bacterium]